jgi:hypothetical protein
MWATESSNQTKERLQAQTTYQAPHVAILWVVEFSLQTKEGLQAQTTYQAPHVVEVQATKSSIQIKMAMNSSNLSSSPCGRNVGTEFSFQTKERLQAQATYQAPHVISKTIKQ